MQLTNEDINQLIDALQERGIAYQIPTETFEFVKDFVPEESELVHITNESHIKVGNSEEAIKDLPYITYTNVQVHKGDSPSLIARKLWQYAQGRVVVGEIKKLGLPKSVVEEMQRQKPDNFSFMVGEELYQESPFSNFEPNAPNAKGAFFRNYHYGEVERDPDAKSRQMLSYQSDANQKWEFWNMPRMRLHAMSGCVEQSNNGAKSSSPSYDKVDSPQWRVSNALQNGLRTSKEMRDKNIMMVSYWRVG